MAIKIEPVVLSNSYFSSNALIFIPSKDNDAPSIKKEWCVFSHGYTASKSDCIAWATRTSEAGSPTIIFDHPGHYLGSFSEVHNFEDFKTHAHENFETAFITLRKSLPYETCERVILGGHSLGALLALKALELPIFKALNPIGIGVGFGSGPDHMVHLFESSFYEKTLNIRRQLVSKALDSDNVFPWIKEEKLSLQTFNKRIHLITGLDDVVVGQGGMEALAFQLKEQNEVTTSEPRKLPHHEPSLAAPHIFAFLKKELNWT